MNIRTGVRTALAVAGLAVASSSASAQVSFSETYTISPTQSVVYVPFTVTTAGDFRFRTLATEMGSDPELILFQGLPGSFGLMLAEDDDSCGEPVCPLNANGLQRNAILQLPLGLGDFTLAVSRFTFNESEARTGFNASVVGDNVIPVLIDSEFGVASQLSTVPEPSSIALLATGVVGLIGAARLRKRA